MRSPSISSTAAAGRRHRIGARQHAGAQPPQRPAGRMALDDPPAGDDEARRVEAEPAQRRRRSRAPATRRRRRGPGPRSGAARSGAPGPYRPRSGEPAALLGPISGRLLPSHPVATNPPPDLVLTPLGGEARPARGVADDVPPRHRRPRPLHQRELVDPAARPTRILEGLRGSRRPGQLPRHRRRPTTPARSSVRSSSASSCSPTPTAPRSRRSGLTELPAFVFVRVDGTRAGGGRGLERGRVAGRRRRHRRRRRRGARRTSRSSATPGRSTARPPSAEPATC